MKMIFSAALAGFLSQPVGAACPLSQSAAYLGTQLLASADHRIWMFAIKHKLVDADGAPNAYHSADPIGGCPEDGLGLDCPANAGLPDKEWWPNVLVRDPLDPSRPYVQSDGPFSGYFVSKTSLRRTDVSGRLSSSSYVDASRVPYLVLPAPVLALKEGPRIGDLGFAVNRENGKSTGFIVADEGPVEPLGEASIAFWRALGDQAPNARNGEGLPSGTVTAVVFARSAKTAELAWPLRASEVDRAGRQIAGQFGQEHVRDCSGTGPSGARVDLERSHALAKIFDKEFGSEDACSAELERWKHSTPDEISELADRMTCASGPEGRADIVLDSN